MFVAPDILQNVSVPDAWNGAYRLDTPPNAGRDACVPALPHTARPFVEAAEPASETEKHLRRSYDLVHKLRQAVSL